MITYLLAVFLIGMEAEYQPTIVSPHTTAESCHRARAELDARIKKEGAADQAYAACLRIELAQPV